MKKYQKGIILQENQTKATFSKHLYILGHAINQTTPTPKVQAFKISIRNQKKM